jgi:superfamily I DNA and/or RNA helicase
LVQEQHHRVLICTPSNAAIDEVLSRLHLQGIFDDSEQSYVKGISGSIDDRRKIKIVRLGDSLENASEVIKQLSLDNQVEAALQQYSSWQTYNAILSELSALNSQYDHFLHANPDFRSYGGRMGIFQKEAQYQEEIETEEGTGKKDKYASAGTAKYGTGSVGTHNNKALSRKKKELEELNATIRSFREFDDKIKQLKREKFEYEVQLETTRKELRVKILKEADVVGATLSSSGRSSFMDTIIQENLTFPTVIIDEAGQTTEPATLLPLRFGCRKLILVGDPRQLPPTVLSRSAERAGLNRSLFERLERAEHEVVMLSIQYRMHPEIRVFPSQYFYNNLLEDSTAIANEIRGQTIVSSSTVAASTVTSSSAAKVTARRNLEDLEEGEMAESPGYNQQRNQQRQQLPQHQQQKRLPPPMPRSRNPHGLVTSPLLSYLQIPPVCFYDSGSYRSDIAERSQGTSYVNPYEVDQILSFLQNILPYLQNDLNIGIISPYKAQVRRILEGCQRNPTVSQAMGQRKDESNRIEVNTVDGFQGREKDIVIFSCVRANAVHANKKNNHGEHTKGSVLAAIGFVADERRLNVAITRAKKALVIFGHADTLEMDPIWKAMIQSFRDRGVIRSGGYEYPVIS